MFNRDWKRYYGDGGHPPACTCVQCSRENATESVTPVSFPRPSGGDGTDNRSSPTRVQGNGGGCGKLVLLVLLVTVGIGIVAVISDDIRRFLAPPQPTPVPVVIVITATPADTPTSTSTPTPTPTPSSTQAPVLAMAPTNTATLTPVPTATLRPTFTPSATGTPTPSATGTSTSTPTATPTVTPTAFVCGYAEMVLMGAGKEHKPCHTPTPTPAPGAAQVSTHTPAPTNTATAQSFQVVVISVPTDTPTAVNTPIPTNTPRVVVVPIRSIAPTATPTTKPAPVHTPTPELTTSAAENPSLRHMEEKLIMLKLINVERSSAGLSPVELGDNISAQLHAENSLANCFSSHWGIDGLKPYMRYSLAGGYQSNGENASGYDYCVKEGDGYRAIRSIGEEIRKAMDGWMSSPGHRRSILDENYKKVNIGLAWDQFHLFAYQHFEADFVEHDQSPSIENNILQLDGSVGGGARFRKKEDLSVQIYYDQPPQTLTRGQLSRAGCYSYEPPVASLRPPLRSGLSYGLDLDIGEHSTCKSPFEIPADTPAPSSPEWFQISLPPLTLPYVVNWITASEWKASETEFSVKADVGALLKEYGVGVYSLVVWGNVGGEDIIISEYSIFHGIVPPGTYTPR